MHRFFITGNGTDVGKTFISSILTEAMEADYWKPVQAGADPVSDSEYVKSLISNNKTVVHAESYRLKYPLSPHAAADKEGITIDLSNIIAPYTENNLIIEGAGGLMVPLNNSALVLDLIKKLDAKVVVVVKNYLGSINHTLLTVEVLKINKIPILGIIFNGETVPSSEAYILSYTQLKCLGRVPQEVALTKSVIIKHGLQFKNTMATWK